MNDDQKHNINFNNSELKIMKIIWEEEPLSAKQITLLATKCYGWNKNTTYTILNSLIKKQAVHREDPGFLCTSLIPIEQVRSHETRSLINRLFSGNKAIFLSAFLENEILNSEEINKLRRLIDQDESARPK